MMRPRRGVDWVTAAAALALVGVALTVEPLVHHALETLRDWWNRMSAAAQGQLVVALTALILAYCNERRRR